MFAADHDCHPRPVNFSRSIAISRVVAAVTIALGIALIGRSIAADPGPLPAPAHATALLPPLDHRLLASSATHGFVETAAPAHVRATSRLRRLGFVAGLNERLHGLYPLQALAVSTAEQFHSSVGARAELASQRERLVSGRGHGIERLGTIGIPGAVGWAGRDGDTTQINVIFTSGTFYYLVGATVSGAGDGGPIRENLIASAQSLYLTASGCVTRPTQPRLV